MSDGLRIGILAPSSVPLQRGGAERLWSGLARAFEADGHLAEVFRLPVRERRLDDLVRGYREMASVDLTHLDVVVTGKYPAWAVDHPRHVVWMLHPLRGVYDTYPADALAGRRIDPGVAEVIAASGDALDPATLASALLDACADADPTDLDIPTPTARAAIHALDRCCLRPRRIERFVAISRTVAGRSEYWPIGIDADVAYPALDLPDGLPIDSGTVPITITAPPAQADGADLDTDGLSVLSVGRLDGPKRVMLLIDAVERHRAAGNDTRLTIVGDGPDALAVAQRAAAVDGVEWEGRADDERLASLYASTDVVAFVPIDEDFGYVTAEAFAHGTPVVTTTDSGGVRELVSDGVNGLVAEPTAAGITAAFDRLRPPLIAKLAAGAAASYPVSTWRAVTDVLLGVVAGEPTDRAADSNAADSNAADPNAADPNAADPNAGFRERRGGHVRARRPRLVAFSTYPVSPQASGGQLRAAHTLGAIARRGIDVEILSVGSRPDEPGALATSTCVIDGDIVETAIVPSGRFLDAERRIRRLVGAVAITDVASGLLWPAIPELVRLARQAVADADAVFLVQPYLHPIVETLAPRHPLLLDEHNVEAVLKRAMYPRSEAGDWLWGKVDTIERTALERAAIIAATTPDDRATLTAPPYSVDPSTVIVTPNGIDTDDSPLPDARTRREARAALDERCTVDPASKVAVFLGSSHGPNLDAAHALIDRAADLDGVEVLLVGSHCDHVEGRLPANVHRLGAVDDDDLSQILSAADVALNPMADGGGSNLKLFTYFAAGVPVVTTAVGARGLVDPARLAVVSEIDQLNSAIGAALADAPRLRAAARDWVAEHGSWTGATAELADRASVIIERSYAERVGGGPLGSPRSPRDRGFESRTRP